MPLETSLTPVEKDWLWQLACDSIQYGWQHRRALPLSLETCPIRLREPGATFVTLHRRSHLRGCLGCLEAFRPLAQDVAENAFAAAFRDPRFPPLQPEEWAELDLKISVLSKPTPLHFQSEADLLQQLTPGKDGLILSDPPQRGTFLPSVWEQLPTPEEFWRNLKRKAGLPKDHWSKTLRVERYFTEEFGKHNAS